MHLILFTSSKYVSLYLTYTIENLVFQTFPSLGQFWSGLGPLSRYRQSSGEWSWLVLPAYQLSSQDHCAISSQGNYSILNWADKLQVVAVDFLGLQLISR